MSKRYEDYVGSIYLRLDAQALWLRELHTGLGRIQRETQERLARDLAEETRLRVLYEQEVLADIEKDGR